MKKRIAYIFMGAGVIACLGLVSAGILNKPAQRVSAAPAAIVDEESLAQAPAAIEKQEPATAVEAPAAAKQQNAGFEFQKGMCYVAWTKDGYSNSSSVASMQEMAALGVEWVSVVSTWFQDRINSTQIHPLNDKTPSDASLLFAIQKLRELNFKIMLKPHLDIIESGGMWRGDIEFANQADWEAWFASYTDFILHYARLAQQENVELLCIGTELSNATLKQPDLWIGLIKKVREVYNGQLTYAANWHSEFSDITFWGQLDYAGLDAYFPLVASDNPDAEQLKAVWQDWLRMIEAWQKKINQPVLLTEIGYKSSQGAAEEPWQHNPSGKVDLKLQAECYQALLATFYEQPWCYGIYWWYWGVSPQMGGELNSGFTLQNKPAEEVIREWYNKVVPQKLY